MPAAKQPSTPVTDHLRRVTAGLKPDRLFPGVAAGVVAGIINVIVAISLAALIFAGDLSGFVSQGIGLILLGGIVAVIVTGLLSSFPGTLTATQDAPGAILAVLAAAILRVILALLMLIVPKSVQLLLALARHAAGDCRAVNALQR